MLFVVGVLEPSQNVDCSLDYLERCLLKTGAVKQIRLGTLRPAVFFSARVESGVFYRSDSRSMQPAISAGRSLALMPRSWDWYSLGPEGPVSPGSHLLQQGFIYHLAPEAPLFNGMATRLKAFLESLVGGLGDCTALGPLI